MILQVAFGRLLIATGSRARRINDDRLDSISKGLQVRFANLHPPSANLRRRSSLEIGDGWLRVVVHEVPIGRGVEYNRVVGEFHEMLVTAARWVTHNCLLCVN